MTIGAVSCTSLTSTGNITAGTNAMTIGALSLTSMSSSNTSGFTFTSTVGSLTTGFNNFQMSATSLTDLNGLGIVVPGKGSLLCGINKNSVTGGVPSNYMYLSTGGTGIGISIGRGNSNLPNSADILIDTSGNVSMTNGSLTCTSITSTGNVNHGTNPMTCGAVSCTSITSTGNVNHGTNPMTIGAISCTSLSSGFGSLSTPAIQVGSTTSGLFRGTYAISPALSLNVSGNQVDFVASGSTTKLLAQGPSYFLDIGDSSNKVGNIYVNALTAQSTSLGNATCSSLTSTGNINHGTYPMTCGGISCTTITSTANITNGTNALTCGQLSCSSITSTGIIQASLFSSTTLFEFVGKQTTLQTITSAVTTSVYVDATDVNTVGFVTGTSSSLITMSSSLSLWVQVNVNIEFPPSSTGVRDVYIFFNGTQVALERRSNSSGNTVDITACASDRLAANSTIEIKARQNAGINMTFGFVRISIKGMF
jgi:hypothetical protein